MTCVREAIREDARAIADIRVEGWRAAYRGLMDDAALDSLDPAADAERYLADWDAGPVRRVAELDGQVVGFAVSGSYRPKPHAPGAEGDGELYALYIRPAAWSRGVGRALLADALTVLRDRGLAVVRLWVLRDNTRARRFYEAAGFAPDGTEQLYRAPGATRPVPEVRYSRPL